MKFSLLGTHTLIHALLKPRCDLVFTDPLRISAPSILGIVDIVVFIPEVNHHLGVEIIQKMQLPSHSAWEFHRFRPQMLTCVVVLDVSHSSSFQLAGIMPVASNSN